MKENHAVKRTSYGTQVPCEVPSLPNSTTHKGSPHYRGVRPLLISNSDVGSSMSHKNKSVKVLWDRTYGFSPLSEKTRKSYHCVITKAALSSPLFKDPECWSGQGLDPRLPAQQTDALPTELTRQKDKAILIFFLRLPSSDQPTFLAFSKNNSINLKNEHSNSIEKNRNKNMNIFHSTLYILFIQICEC